MELLHKQACYQIVGAFFAVYKEKGCGFLEPVYQECMEIELDWQNIPSTAEPDLKLFYRGRQLKHGYKPDFICYDKIVVELKVVQKLSDEHRAKC